MTKWANYNRNKNFNCQISTSILGVAINQPPYKIVQGHLWEHIAITIISTYYKNSTKHKSSPSDLIKNLAFSAFIKNPFDYMDSDFQKHYKQQFSRIGL